MQKGGRCALVTCTLFKLCCTNIKWPLLKETFSPKHKIILADIKKCQNYFFFSLSFEYHLFIFFFLSSSHLLPQYTAFLRMPEWMSIEQKMKYVRNVIDLLDLRQCQDTSESTLLFILFLNSFFKRLGLTFTLTFAQQVRPSLKGFNVLNLIN